MLTYPPEMRKPYSKPPFGTKFADISLLCAAPNM